MHPLLLSCPCPCEEILRSPPRGSVARRSQRRPRGMTSTSLSPMSARSIPTFRSKVPPLLHVAQEPAHPCVRCRECSQALVPPMEKYAASSEPRLHAARRLGLWATRLKSRSKNATLASPFRTGRPTRQPRLSQKATIAAAARAALESRARPPA